MKLALLEIIFLMFNFTASELSLIKLISLINSLLFIAKNVLAHIFKRPYLNIKLGSPIPVFDVGQIFEVLNVLVEKKNAASSYCSQLPVGSEKV